MAEKTGRSIDRFYYPGFVQNLVPGALSAYDLQDLAATLAPRRLLLVGTTDGNGKKLIRKALIMISQ
ncbi:MAG: alpha/beta hydrolase family protein [Bacteroidales bacterium]|nr:alpha/beta hydrolase family protein [Bacteroidales bacterium]